MIMSGMVFLHGYGLIRMCAILFGTHLRNSYDGEQ